MKPGKILIPPNAKWPALGKLSTRLTLVSIVILALCLTGCGATRNAQSKTLTTQQLQTATQTAQIKQTADTALQRDAQTLRILKTEAIAASQAALAISIDSIATLPKGAQYSSRSGRAKATVMRAGKDSIIVYADCDSLQQKIVEYERTCSSLQQSLKHTLTNDSLRKTAAAQLEAKEASTSFFRSNWGNNILAFAAGGIAALIIALFKKE